MTADVVAVFQACPDRPGLTGRGLNAPFLQVGVSGLK